MKIHVVTGATGFIGRHLVQELLAQHKTVWIIVRAPLKPQEKIEKIFPDLQNKYKHSLRIVKGDVLKKNLGIDVAELKSLDSHEVWFWHLAANLSFHSTQKDSVLKTNIEGTKNLVELANKLGKKVLFMSTAYVSGDKKYFAEDQLEEDQHFRNTYEKSKFEAEKIIQSSCTVSYLIFRPSIVIGNAYEGKAAGCTFGYYRYIFLFFLLKTWIKNIIRKNNSTRAKILSMLRTKYDSGNDILYLPWIILPFPNGSTVDLIPVDYLIDSIIQLSTSSAPSGTVFHLTNPNPPSYKYLLDALVEDLGITGIRHVGVPQSVFVRLFPLLHVLLPSLRTYIQSLMWYLPYITYRTYFSQKNIKKFSELTVPELNRDRMRRINTYAKNKIFQHIAID